MALTFYQIITNGYYNLRLNAGAKLSVVFLNYRNRASTSFELVIPEAGILDSRNLIEPIQTTVAVDYRYTVDDPSNYIRFNTGTAESITNVVLKVYYDDADADVQYTPALGIQPVTDPAEFATLTSDVLGRLNNTVTNRKWRKANNLVAVTTRLFSESSVELCGAQAQGNIDEETRQRYEEIERFRQEEYEKLRVEREEIEKNKLAASAALAAAQESERAAREKEKQYDSINSERQSLDADKEAFKQEQERIRAESAQNDIKQQQAEKAISDAKAEALEIVAKAKRDAEKYKFSPPPSCPAVPVQPTTPAPEPRSRPFWDNWNNLTQAQKFFILVSGLFGVVLLIRALG
ncbi:hypothetical protein AV955_gp012 [Diadromus pulchellus ascovirus 4a]|uniref:Complete DpAV4 genome n=2 Tax=Diadromus pulchellus ascovirus 4a TaxID=158683 RepID=F2NYU1_9VIRU|nr:hypothetical protein AV955_gp012 [Diadromus pulchellus ascovirus 4a]CCA61369.1 unnamed protein product [Diadromus pulchellus ascovirus 4a]